MDFLVPKLSATMESAKVLRWLKQPGDKIKSGDPLVELETDKAAMEVESPVDGVLGTIVAAEGVDVAIGAQARRHRRGRRCLRARQAGRRAAAQGGSASPGPEGATPSGSGATCRAEAGRRSGRPGSGRVERRRGAHPRLPARPPPGARAGHRPRRPRPHQGRARPQGRYPRRAALRRGRAHGGAAGPGRTPRSATARPCRCPPMRARIAETVTVSRQTIPAFTLDRFVSTEAIARAKATIGADIERDAGIKLTLTDFFLQALADTLFHNPAMLQRFADAGGRPGSVSDGTVDVGLVVAVEGGMMIPVLPDLGGRSLAEIGIARRDATQRVRSGRLVAGDGAPVPIALSNLSRGGADRFEAIIGPGQSSVLAVGREHEAVVARGGMPAVVTGVHLTLSVDHRLIDGVVGATFLGQLADRIEFGPWQAG